MIKTYIHLLLALLSPLIVLNEAAAQPAAAAARSFKDMLKDVPAKEMLKLFGPKKVEVAASISQQINAKEVGKVGTYRGKVSKVDPYSYPNENLVGWRLGVEDNFKRGGDTIGVFTWVMVHTDPTDMIPKIRVGDEITVTGKVNRAELTATDAPRLNVDLIVPVMNDGKIGDEKAAVEKPAIKPGMPNVPAAPAVVPAPGAVAARPADYPLDRILDALPEASRATLSTAPLSNDAIPALNKALSTLALHKPIRLTFAVEESTVVPQQPEKFRIRAAKGLLSGKYPAIQQQWVHLYMPSAKATEIAKVGVGDTVTMSGVINRFDIITTPQGIRQLQLNIDDAQLVPSP